MLYAAPPDAKLLDSAQQFLHHKPVLSSGQLLKWLFRQRLKPGSVQDSAPRYQEGESR